MKRIPAALLVVLLGVLLTAAPAHAATHTVTLTIGGPSPSAITIAARDTVRYVAGDGRTYHVRSNSSNWKVDAAVTTAKPLTRTFVNPGTYDYTMTFTLLIGGESQPMAGAVVVPAAPKPSPTTKPSATTRPSASAAPRPVGSTPASTAGPTAAATSSGVALPPPIVGGVVPTANPTASTGPTPQVAPGVDPGFSPSAAPAASVDYADPKGLVQGSAHGFGLPAAVAVVAFVGVVTLLVRLLLAQPEARPDVR